MIKNVKHIDFNTINQFVNCIRAFFLEEKFHEIILYDQAEFLITNVDQIKTDFGTFLRASTEPDIWQLGISNDRFFCITSLFRKEDPISWLHKNEFKIADFYMKDASEERITNLFFVMLDYLEQRLQLPQLSQAIVNQCDFGRFSEIDFSAHEGQIFKITNYPIEESFYDAVDEDSGKSKKGELFFIINGKPIEFSVFGQVGENRNPNTNVEGLCINIHNIDRLNLFGMCLGIERTILCYESLKKR